VIGHVDLIETFVRLSGWAGDLTSHRPVRSLVVTVDQVPVATLHAGKRRHDVAAATTQVGFADAGFEAIVRTPVGGRVDIHAEATDGSFVRIGGTSASLPSVASARGLYLDLLKRALIDELSEPADPKVRREGRDWPSRACTMIGLERLNNLQHCIEDVLLRQIPGDLIETGVWRGGASIFMRAVLKAYGITDRVVWLADSFEGMPRPDPERYPADDGDTHQTFAERSIPLDEVKANFEKFGMLDDRVRFLKGRFRDTLSEPEIRQLAILRLDGDMYESTSEPLVQLYSRVSIGGYVIIDDYGAIPACRKAVDDFRTSRGIEDKLRWIDWTGTYWQRLK
jgi:hypothetical protein